MNTQVKVIVNKCRWDARANSWVTYSTNQQRTDGCIIEKPMVEATFPDVDAAKRFADPLRDKGVSVFVCPTYNENDDKGRFFREWRSFDGEDFNEVRFDY